KGIRVNAVCPGIIETEMTDGLHQNNELEQILWRGTQSAGLGNRKKLRQRYSISARQELHSSPELHYRWTAVFSRKPGSFERAYTWSPPSVEPVRRVGRIVRI